jgi:hypothetical protein
MYPPYPPNGYLSKLDLEKSLEDFRGTMERIAQQHGNPETYRHRMGGINLRSRFTYAHWSKVDTSINILALLKGLSHQIRNA